MTTVTQTNSYGVSFVFDYAVVKAYVFALSEDAAIALAADLIIDDLGIKTDILDQAQDILVDVLDEDVL